MSILVLGHRNPDTDAIVAALGYADFLRRTTRPDAEAACCGEISPRTLFVLERAGVEPPRLVMDVRPRVRDLARRDVVSARADEPVFDVYRRMQQHGVRTVPVLGADRSLAGMVSILHLLQVVFPEDYLQGGTRTITSSLERVRHVLGGRFAHAVEPARDQDLLVVVGAMSAEGFTARMRQYPPGQLVIVSGDRPTIHLPAIEYGVRCLVITGGYELSPALLGLAEARGVTVLHSPHDTATTTLVMRGAKRLTPIIETPRLTFPASALVADARARVRDSAQHLFPVLDEAGLVAGVFTKSDLVAPPRRQLVLVDHNELAQAVTGADEAEILEVIDHHRLGGGLVSREPIHFINEPVGSTSTIVAGFFRRRGLAPGKPIALCLAAGIVADTLNLTSPTATPTDAEALAWLAAEGGFDPAGLAADFFAAGSALETHAPAEAVRLDRKEYREGRWRFTAAQIEEAGLDRFWKHRAALEAELQAHARQESLDFACLLITDLTQNSSLLLATGRDLMLDAIDYPRLEAGLFRLDGIVSRKKQLLPHLIRLLARLGDPPGGPPVPTEPS